MSARFSDITSAIVTCNTVHTLLRLLDTSNRYSIHQCSMECMFSSKNCLDIKMIPNASEIF
jgi:hypothetical protein